MPSHCSNSMWLVLLLLAAGCGRSVENESESLSEVSALPVARDSAPAVVVSAFLDALRAGDNSTAEQLLTTTAREQTLSHNLPLQAPGSPTATYLIGRTMRIDGGVQVGSRWTERSENGEPIIYDIDWVLRQQADGWRVVGMSMALTPQGKRFVVSFENVEAMLKTWDEADDEIAREQQDTAVLEARQSSNEQRR